MVSVWILDPNSEQETVLVVAMGGSRYIVFPEEERSKAFKVKLPPY